MRVIRLVAVLALCAQLAAADTAPIEPAATENLVAYARLLGYVRHFHPSDQAANLNWDRFTADTIERVESSRTPAELASRLETIFRPVAPLSVSFRPPRPGLRSTIGNVRSIPRRRAQPGCT